jgi:3-hydroxybutyryl-CoA dehydrogenase
MARPLMRPPRIIGVVGAGTMGAGIAQLGCLAGIETRLHDSSPEALATAITRIDKDLDRGVERGRWSTSRAAAAKKRLHPAVAAAELQGAELVIEAVPEDLELKAQVIAALPADAVIATNTSSLSVTAIAARTAHPELVVGMHFFNPPPLMKLVEVIRGTETAQWAIDLADATARAMERTPIAARDGIGFVANRGGRPFYSEALRLVDEGLATPSQVDRICRLGAGFRMGPFELMDLVGIDVGLIVAESFASQSMGEPRWKPSSSQRRLVAAGRFGRKSGRGWYDYRDGPHRPEDPAPPAVARTPGQAVAILGDGADADALRTRAGDRGFSVSSAPRRDEPLVICMTAAAAHTVPDGLPHMVPCTTTTLAALARPAAVGFHLLPPVGEATLIELTRLPSADPTAARRVEEVAAALGLYHEWVDDAPGLVLGRIVAQLVNEACFAVGEGVASPDDVDLAMRLGLNHPHGPIAWGDRIGWDAVLARIDGLWADRHDDRYRAAPLLRRAAATGTSVRKLIGRAPRGFWE